MLRRQSNVPNIASSSDATASAAVVDPEKGGGRTSSCSNEMTTICKSKMNTKNRTRIRPRRNAGSSSSGSRHSSSNIFLKERVAEWSTTVWVVFIFTILFTVMWLQQAYVNITILSTIDNGSTRSSSSSSSSKFGFIRSPSLSRPRPQPPPIIETDKIAFESIEDGKKLDSTLLTIRKTRSDREVSEGPDNNDEDSNEQKESHAKEEATKQQQQQQQQQISEPVVSSHDSAREGGVHSEQNDGSSITDNNFSTNDDLRSFLIFQTGVLTSQGLGNIMSGMIAAVMLAEESNRTFCHVGYESFEHAFEFKDQRQKVVCDEAIRNDIDNPQKHFISMDNFGTSAFQSECQLKDMLSDHDKFQTIWFSGNTYPRWPPKFNLPDSRRDLFHELFQPTDQLLSILPWPQGLENPPAVVVHLREPDKQSNDWYRPGLDDTTFDVLASDVFKKKVSGELFRLGKGDSERIDDPPIFLVTNSVGWYNRFPNWNHPKWEKVQHSVNFLRQPHFTVTGAPRKNQNTKTNNNENGESGPAKNENKSDRLSDAKYQQGMQMWSDWYTLLNSKLIYHTHSDFSISAARWNQNILSWTILDSKNQPPSSVEETDGGVGSESTTNHEHSSTVTPPLILEPDFLEQESATVPPLFERRDAEMPSTYSMNVNKSELKHCAVLEIVANAKTNESGNSTEVENSNSNNTKPAASEHRSGIDKNEFYEQMKMDQLKNMVESRRARLEQEGRQLLPSPANPK